MSKYEDEMFNFIVHEDNFNFALEISEMLPDVKNRLLDEFWELVIDTLRELDAEKKWEFALDDIWIDIYSNAGGSFYFAFYDINNRPWIGIWLEEEGDKLRGQRILEEMDLMKNLKPAKREEAVAYINHHEKIQSDSFIKSIIPSKRTNTAKEISNWIWDFILEHEEAIIKMNANA